MALAMQLYISNANKGCFNLIEIELSERGRERVRERERKGEREGERW